MVPNDFPLKVALSCVDVSRLVPQVERLVRSKPGANIVILGAGKAGLLTAVAARYFDPKANIIVFDFKPQNLVCNVAGIFFANSFLGSCQIFGCCQCCGSC